MDEQRKKTNAERTAANMRRQQKAKEERKKAKARARQGLNIKESQPATTATKKEYAQKERIRKSENAKWKQMRYERYQKRVWPGWRTSARPGKIIKYNINDASQNKVNKDTQ